MASKSYRFLAVDTECTGLHPWGDIERWGHEPARPFAFSFCDEHGHTTYVHWEVDGPTRRVTEPDDGGRSRELLQKMLGNPKTVKVLHNARYDLRMLALSGLQVRGRVHDTLVMAHIVTGGNEMVYGLKPLAKKFLGYDDGDQKDLKQAVASARRKAAKKGWCLATKEHQGRDPLQADYWMASRDMVKKYAVGDAVRTMGLFLGFTKVLRKDKQLLALYRKEMELFWVLWRMENRGVRVFPDRLKKIRGDYEKVIAEQKLRIKKEGAKGLNIRSPKQMVEEFFVRRGHAVMTRTKTGAPKCDKDVLFALAQRGDHLADAIMEYRTADQTLRNFIDVYDKLRVLEGETVE